MISDIQTQAPRRPAGFTLIEIVLGIALLALLFGGIFAVARGALQISAEVTENQQYSMRIHSYLELLRRTFEDMPGNAQVQLRPLDGRGFESEVAFLEYPLAFAWSGVPAGSQVVVFRTATGGSGWLQSRIYYLTDEMAEQYLNGGRLDTSAPNLLIMDEIKMVQWRFFDQRTDEWMTEWQENGQRPSLVELNVEFLDGSNPFAVVFWIPTVVNPEQIARSLNTTGGAQGGAVPGGVGRGQGGPGGGRDGAQGGGDGGRGGPGGGGRGGQGQGRGGAGPGGGRGGPGGGRQGGGIPGQGNPGGR